MAITFNGYKVPPDFTSDGCTCAPDSWFGKDLKPACIMHDFHRRYAILPAPEADKVFKHHLRALGCPRLISHWYWLAVKLTRKHYSRTEILPMKWAEYK